MTWSCSATARSRPPRSRRGWRGGWGRGDWPSTRLGFDWGEHLYHASDYFEPLYEWAVLEVKSGQAYVDDHTADEIRERGGTDRPGQESLYRDRSVAENLDLFQRMREGRVPRTAPVRCAPRSTWAPATSTCAIPVLYRILHLPHHTGDAWCLYPMYDFAHGQSTTSRASLTSICTLEFEVHRPLYEWILEALELPACIRASTSSPA